MMAFAKTKKQVCLCPNASEKFGSSFVTQPSGHKLRGTQGVKDWIPPVPVHIAFGPLLTRI